MSFLMSAQPGKSNFATIQELIDEHFTGAKLRSGNVDASLMDGYEVQEIKCSGPHGKFRSISIFPYVKWTCGSYRPCYGGTWSCSKNNVHIELPA